MKKDRSGHEDLDVKMSGGRIRSSYSHVPVLTLLPLLKPIRRVLELGAGYSTKIFTDEKVYPDIERFDSYDNGPKDYVDVCRRSLANTDDRYQLHGVNNVPMVNMVKKTDLNLYDFIFIDDSISNIGRTSTISNVVGRIGKDSKTIVAIHDFEFSTYHQAVGPEWTKFVFDSISPEMGILWKKGEVDLANMKHFDKLIAKHFKKIGFRWSDWLKFFIENKIGS